MARYRRSLEDLLADAASQNRASAGVTFSTPAMVEVTIDHLDPLLKENIETVNADMATLANTISNLEISQGNSTSELVELNQSLIDLDKDLVALDGQLTENAEQVAADKAQLALDLQARDAAVDDAISDANARPITSDRFTENSLTIWPFVHNAIPQGAFAPGAVGSSDLADFSIVVKKFKDDRHRLY